MAGYKDQRPTRADDSLKRLLGRVENKQTVPHGVKVARSFEATLFEDSSGTSWRWDGDAVANFDSRMTAANNELTAAKSRLDKNEADIADANSRIQAASGDLSAQIDQINANTAKADKAAADLVTVNSELDQAQADISSMNTSIDSAVSKSDQALSTANSASSAASAAQDTANQASALAQEVQATADNARSAAEAAEAKAREAAGLADSKGKTYYGSTAPATGTTADLWIKSPENTPHVWDAAAAKWVAVTDKAATDAASAAAKAQSDATKALSDAAAAASTAQQAQVAAGNAQKSADGKTTNQYGTVTPPPNPGVKAGDTYYYTGTDNRIIEVWQWSGTGWTKRKIESAQLANFDAGYITSGYLDVAKRIQAGSIFADKLTIGIGDNIMPPLVPTANIPNAPSGSIISGGIGATYAASVPASTSTNGFYLSGTTTGDYLLKVSPFAQYRISAFVKSASSATATLYIRWVDSAAGTWAWGPKGSVSVSAGTDWTAIADTFSPPNDGKTYDKLYIGVYATGSHNSDVLFSGIAVRSMKDGSLIVSGSITGDKVNAQSVAASVGQFVQVKAQNVEVTQDLAARVVNSMDVTSKRLVVTEDALLNNAVFLGNTVADQLNVTKKLVARDAIVDGTLDAAQINVTGELSANIVNAMDVASKKLVVTDEAILNRATVVESIVTPTLVADRVNAALVTGKVIQTSTATNTGVKIDSNGYKAYDTNGNLAVNLDGKDNLMVGSFRTSTQSSSGVKISQGSSIAAIDLYTPNWGGNVTTQNSHGGIWFSVPDRLSDRALNIFATDNAAVGANDPGIMLSPAGGTIDFQGRFGISGNAFQRGVEEFNSAVPDGWWTINVTFLKPLTSDPAVFISPITENNVECAIGIKNATRTGFTAVVVNKSKRDSGYAWLKWIALAI